MEKNALLNIAKEFVSFVNKACTPFHAVKVTEEILQSFGYVYLDERNVGLSIAPGGKYYITRNGTSIVAFSVGAKFTPDKGLKIVGAHTDSPNFSLKPKTVSVSGKFQRVGVQCYGGGLWHTWFDRDLTVAGRVILDRESLEPVLIRVSKPLLRIPTLAIHLCDSSEKGNFKPNNESHLIPVISTAIEEKANESNLGEDKKHSVPLLEAVADAAGCKPEEILDYDLSVIDTQEASIGGAYDEFIFAPRIDNLLSCFCAIKALVESIGNEQESMIRMICLFDSEEIGSHTLQGAGGTLIPDIIERILQGQALRSTLVANSFFLSVDGAHALHPNYSEKHEAQHRPHFHGGPVIKYNANSRYATNGYTAAIIKRLAKTASVPIQEFVVKNDTPCGSTIGPITSTLLGIQTADIGNPMLSMHSIREMCGTTDIYYLIELIKSFFHNYKS